jgi:LemA protein
MRGALIALVVVLIVAAFVACWAVVWRDSSQLAMERNDIEARWTQLDKDMKVRANMISGSVSFRELADARAALLGAGSRKDEMTANTRLTSALLSFQQLGSDEALQDRLADAAQKIYDDRREYNAAIQRYNTDLELFPKNIAAWMFHYRRYDAYFQTPEVDKNVAR